MSIEEGNETSDSPSPSVRPSKRMIILAVGIISIVLIACSVGLYRHISTSQASNKATQLTQAKKNARPYTLTPPTDWMRVQPTPEGTTVAFSSIQADTDAGGTLKAFVVVQSTELNAEAKKLSFDKVAQAYVAQLAQSYEGFTLLSTDSKTVGGIPAVLTTFSCIQGKAQVTISSLFIVKQGISYAVNGEALTSTWPNHAGKIEQSLLSFRP